MVIARYAANQTGEMMSQSRAVAVVPSNDLRASEAFYRLLAFRRDPGDQTYEDYLLMREEAGAEINLTKA